MFPNPTYENPAIPVFHQNQELAQARLEPYRIDVSLWSQQKAEMNIETNDTYVVQCTFKIQPCKKHFATLGEKKKLHSLRNKHTGHENYHEDIWMSCQYSYI